MKTRCEWVSDDKIYIDYHDIEWGVPEHDDNKLFEHLILDCHQAGLSWLTILKKRENYRLAFDQFNPKKIAIYDDKKISELLSNDGIIRNKLKIKATIQNAKGFLTIQKEFGSFNSYIWSFIGGSTKVNKWKCLKELPAKTFESEQMSKDLKKRGFSFV
ncbi:MAG: DNA-3-methyladenine glycosylase I, partial [Spirochaetota bacterium]|nr:DNA-3-methyladenine glycosylase I [Spirochaetota bacterium]